MRKTLVERAKKAIKVTRGISHVLYMPRTAFLSWRAEAFCSLVV